MVPISFFVCQISDLGTHLNCISEDPPLHKQVVQNEDLNNWLYFDRTKELKSCGDFYGGTKSLRIY